MSVNTTSSLWERLFSLFPSCSMLFFIASFQLSRLCPQKSSELQVLFHRKAWLQISLSPIESFACSCPLRKPIDVSSNLVWMWLCIMFFFSFMSWQCMQGWKTGLVDLCYINFFPESSLCTCPHLLTQWVLNQAHGCCSAIKNFGDIVFWKGT